MSEDLDSAGSQRVAQIYDRRTSRRFTDRLQRILTPPLPFVMNPRENIDAPLGRWNLYIGGGGCQVDGYVNLDLFPFAGVDVIADAETLPFEDGTFQRVECDAVLEHVRKPEIVMREIERVLKPGGFAHIVTPFAHPFHEYPRDYRRFTIDGLEEIKGGLQPVASGWRTGPTATMLVFTIEYAKLLFPWKWWRVLAHGVLGWILFPFRYIDLLLFRSPDARRIGNHCYVWFQKTS
ncbi:MAG TPA: class I SAM-dependent methyltransferase [Bryobacteraceae bacterium]